MKVYLGGTVNDSSWREYVISNIQIEYFNPVVEVWNDEAYDRELYERRHCDFVLYVITPRMTGFYSLAEVTDDAIKRPDRTIFSFLKEDGEFEFNGEQLTSLEHIGKRVERNGGLWLKSLEEVIHYLNTAKKQTTDFQALKSESLDAFISFGRKSSKNLVQSLSEFLTTHGISNWYDDGLIPLEIRHLEAVNRLIEKSHTFIFVISSHAVRSEYCLRELEYACKLKKRIIPLMHEQPKMFWEKMPDIIKNGKTLYYTSIRTQKELFSHLGRIIHEHQGLTHDHTRFLLHALKWQDKSRDPKYLLYGKDRTEGVRWLKHLNTQSNTSVEAPALLSQYIQTSESLNITAQILHFLDKFTSVLTSKRFFDNFIGIISLANPLSLLPQLYNILTTTDRSSISEYTFSLFAILNLCFTLVGIKQKNFGMFLSMFLSMAINLAIVIIKCISG